MDAFTFIGNTPWLAALSVVILGLLVGSFLNVVIVRFPIMLFRSWKRDCQGLADLPDHPALTDLSKSYNLLKPDSHCPKCQTPVRAWQNIPVISWVLLRGKCAGCKSSISARYPIIEIITAALSLTLMYVLPWGLPLAVMLVFTWLLIAMAVIDIDHQILPDTMTLGLLWLGLLVNTQSMFIDLTSAVWGAIAGYGVLWTFFWIFKLCTGKEGMGYGDFKLLAALGAWLGVQSIPLIIILSSAVGAIVGILAVLILGRDKNLPIPFGPYLAAAGWIAALWGPQITSWYASLL